MSLTPLPLEDWYQQTLQSDMSDTCPVCKVIIASNLCDCVIEEWAALHSSYELDLTAQALAYVTQGGSLFEWAKGYWMFNYAKTLSEIEFTQLIKDKLPRKRIVHIGCGALPFTGIYFSQVMEKVTLIDLDPVAFEGATKLVQAVCPDNTQVLLENGKATAFAPDDLVLIASMVLDKESIFASAAAAGVRDLLIRSTDDRARGIFYQKMTTLPEKYGYHFVARTYPPKEIGNVTYHYRLKVS